MTNSRSSYWYLLLFIPAWVLFYVLMTWLGCKPLGELAHLPPEVVPQVIPEGATCFADNHLSWVVFFSYPPAGGSLIPLLLITSALVLLLWAMAPACIRLLSRLRGMTGREHR